jgi:predicted transcriptional regulator
MKKRKEDLDINTVYELLEKGATRQEIAKDLGCTTGMLSKRLADIKIKQGLLLEYRTLQALELTEIQARILENITDDKIIDASLKDLVYAFKILKDKELVTEGKPSEIKGLVAYLVEMEKQEMEKEKEEEKIINITAVTRRTRSENLPLL